MTIPTITVTPSAAAGAYRRVDGGADLGAPTAGGTDFAAALSSALQGVVDTGHDADAKSMQAVVGGGNLTDLVMAVNKAELALQTTVAIRDRVVQAYQEILRMPI